MDLEEALLLYLLPSATGSTGSSLWPALLSAVAALLGAALGALASWRVYALQARQGLEQEGASVQLNMNVRVFPCDSAIDDDGLVTRRWIVETNLEVINAGGESWVIPALYTRARALRSLHADEPFLVKSDFDKLGDCGDLSRMANAARVGKKFLSYVTAGETEHFKRWDIVDERFLEEHPVVVFDALAFIAPHKTLGIGHGPKLKGGSRELREAWLNFMNGPLRTDYARHQRVIFDKADEDVGLTIKAGDRVLVDPHTGTVDERNTESFRRLLSCIRSLDVQQTVDLRELVERDAVRTTGTPQPPAVLVEEDVEMRWTDGPEL